MSNKTRISRLFSKAVKGFKKRFKSVKNYFVGTKSKRSPFIAGMKNGVKKTVTYVRNNPIKSLIGLAALGAGSYYLTRGSGSGSADTVAVRNPDGSLTYSPEGSTDGDNSSVLSGSFSDRHDALFAQQQCYAAMQRITGQSRSGNNYNSLSSHSASQVGLFARSLVDWIVSLESDRSQEIMIALTSVIALSRNGLTVDMPLDSEVLTNKIRRMAEDHANESEIMNDFHLALELIADTSLNIQ